MCGIVGAVSTRNIVPVLVQGLQRAPRQQARFLCGLTSPALTKAKLSKHALFGTLESQRFLDVLGWCQLP